MERVRSCDLDIDLQSQSIVAKDGSYIYKTNSKELVKVYNPKLLNDIRKDLVEKLTYSEPIEGIVSPNKLVYTHDNFIGYTMNELDGIPDIEYEEGLEDSLRYNLHRIADKYLKLEEMVKNAPEGVVFPGLLDRENMIIDSKGKMNIYGYDNLQIGNKKAIRKSDKLGNGVDLLPKYFDGEKYTKELDIRSLTLYYLELAFGLKQDNYNSWDVRKTFASRIDINNSIIEKILKIHDDEEPNEYLGTDVLKIADKFVLVDNDDPKYRMTKKLVLK